MKIKRLIFSADGLNLYEIEDSFIVTDQRQHILKESKKIQTCSRYILKTLQSRKAAERYAIEEINKSKV
jgi:hypothetical protein